MVVGVIGFVAFFVWAISSRNAAEDGCGRAGGVAVKSHYGPLVCVKRDALIPESEWRP
jgi:hypothetical protein